MNKAYNWFNWKKIIFYIIAFLFLLLFIYFVYLYHFIMNTKVLDEEKTKQLVFDSSVVTSIEEIYHFQEKEAYHIVVGRDEQNKQWYVFVPLIENVGKDDLIMMESDNLLSKDEIKNLWLKECKQCTLLSSSPAMINQKPLWELTYTDSSNRYVITYFSLENGSTYEQVKLYRKYSERG